VVHEPAGVDAVSQTRDQEHHGCCWGQHTSSAASWDGGGWGVSTGFPVETAVLVRYLIERALALEDRVLERVQRFAGRLSWVLVISVFPSEDVWFR